MGILDAPSIPAARVPAPPVSGVKGAYDRRLSVYNLKPSHLRRARAALAKARNGVGYCTLGFVGDSTTGGVGATAGSTDWPSQLGALLTATGYTLASEFAVAYKSSVADARINSGSGWGALSGNSNLAFNSTTTSPLTFSSTKAGTTAKLYYAQSGGPFTVSIDGGAAVTVTPAGGNSIGVYTVGSLANTTHTVSVVRVSGNSEIFGFEVVSATSGIRLVNEGIGGSLVTATGSSGWFTAEQTIAGSTAGFSADLAFLMWETNDTGVTADATYQANLQNAITQIKNRGTADLVLVTAVPSSGKDFTTKNAILYGLADSNDLPLIDLQDRMGTYTSTNSLGLMSDGLHPTASGYADVARAVQQALGL